MNPDEQTDLAVMYKAIAELAHEARWWLQDHRELMEKSGTILDDARKIITDDLKEKAGALKENKDE